MTEPLPQSGFTLVLPDGRSVLIRPIHADDATRLQALHRRLSKRSARLRFFAAIPELPPEMARRFAEVDFVVRAAFVAAGGDGQIYAVARYEPISPGLVEVAFVVEDDYQRQGIARVLFRQLVAFACGRGISRMRALVLAENVGMLELLRDSGYPMAVSSNRETRTVDVTITSGGLNTAGQGNSSGCDDVPGCEAPPP